MASLTLLVFATLGLTTLQGCFHGSPDSCSDSSDCFAGETCTNGTCTSTATDTGSPPSPDSSEADGSQNEDDDGGLSTDTSTPPAETGVDSSSGADGDAGCARPEDSASLGDCCADSSDCAEGTCIEQACVHVIAVTNQTFDGNLGGLNGADTKCQMASKDAPVFDVDEGSWKAILSTDSVDARNRIEVDAAVYNLDGDLVAKESDTIWGSLDSMTPRSELNFTLDGNPTPNTPQVWTGTGSKGYGGTQSATPMPYPNCEDWTNNSSGNGKVGDATADHELYWIFDDDRSCSKKARIYCINGQ